MRKDSSRLVALFIACLTICMIFLLVDIPGPDAANGAAPYHTSVEAFPRAPYCDCDCEMRIRELEAQVEFQHEINMRILRLFETIMRMDGVDPSEIEDEKELPVIIA